MRFSTCHTCAKKSHLVLVACQTTNEQRSVECCLLVRTSSCVNGEDASVVCLGRSMILRCINCPICWFFPCVGFISCTFDGWTSECRLKMLIVNLRILPARAATKLLFIFIRFICQPHSHDLHPLLFRVRKATNVRPCTGAT